MHCTVDQPLRVGELKSGSIRRGGGSVRISFSAPAEEGITVRLCVHEGQIILYASTSVPNPSAALHDWNTTIRAPEYQHTLVCSSTFFNNLGSPNLISENILSRGRRQTGENSNDSVTLYLSVEGLENFNEFSLNSSQGKFNFGMHMSSMCVSKTVYNTQQLYDSYNT